MANMNLVTMESLKKMSLVELEKVNTIGLTPVLKQLIGTRLKTLTTPLEQVQELVSTTTITTQVVKVPKNKPNETTRTIESFKDDSKGIRAGSLVSFLENNRPGSPTITGKVFRLFDFWLKPERQEAKIKGDNGQRYYRFEKDIQLTIPKSTIPQVEDGSGI